MSENAKTVVRIGRRSYAVAAPLVGELAMWMRLGEQFRLSESEDAKENFLDYCAEMLLASLSRAGSRPSEQEISDMSFDELCGALDAIVDMLLPGTPRRIPIGSFDRN